MIIALLALAFAMILCGLLAIFLGWEIILVERGWTMVLAGTIGAASGVLLLGITAAVSRLAKIQAELARLQGGFEGEALAPVRESTGFSLAALAGGLLDGKSSGKSAASKQDEAVEVPPDFADHVRHEDEQKADGASESPAGSKPQETILPFKPRAPLEPTPLNDEEASTTKVPDFLLVDRDVDTRISDVDESLYATETMPEKRGELPDESADRDEVVTPAAWPEPSAAPLEETAPEPEPDIVAAEPQEQRPATIIGTYNSGDNRYVMFSDGSIEAQTPRGVFRFKSLDELKEFIASGGESNTSAAI